jgi:hypothetical protein
MIHQLKIEIITMVAWASPPAPSGTIPAVFILWIEENISPRPEQQRPGGCLVYTLDQADSDQD